MKRFLEILDRVLGDSSSPATFSYVPLFLNKIGKPQMNKSRDGSLIRFQRIVTDQSPLIQF